MRLRRLQSDLQAYLLGRPNAAAQHVMGTDRLDAPARLQVYADAYRIRLHDALADDFAALRAWLGPERFAELADAYLAAHPSGHYSLRWFGRHLARFLAETPPYAATPLLAELAAFEWALVTAFDAPDAPTLARTALAALPSAAWPALRLHVHPSVVRLDLKWNVVAIRKGAEAAVAPLPDAIEAAVAPWLIWRRNYTVCYRSLAIDEAQALDALRRGIAFADICAGLSGHFEATQAAVRAAALLQRWITEGLLLDHAP